ncbi:MAG TPA: 2-oxoglutarate and iron-dependent oxygenase domain-containing protein [Kineosporiaceae bacterium]|nr:2-oxoglutarate and iron-dependent oxygenase domain-containing protein [Kineosporiaceae bacterium]
MTSIAVPVIDLRDVEGANSGAEAARRRLLDVARGTGGFLLTGHGLDETTADALFAAARRFFALPDEQKLQIENVNSPHFRGYTRVGGELTAGAVDWREQLDVGAEKPAPELGPDSPGWERLIGPNLWPEQVPELKELALQWYAALTDVGLRLLRALALAIGQSEDVFTETFAATPDSLLKIVRYPGRRPAEGDQGVGPHTDSGVLTFVLQEPGTTGLQTLVGETWVDVPAVPGTLAVNVGELLEVATDGLLRANVHRVLSPADGADRLSVPFFLNPELSVTVPRLQLPEHLRPLATGTTRVAGNPFYATYGENALKSRLRSHPNVAERHHADLLARRPEPPLPQAVDGGLAQPTTATASASHA